MTIENRDLAPGTKLAGSYKKTTYVCEVVITAEGETRFQLEDGRLFTSPSSAGKAVMNGVSCNGWRFWSLAAEDYATAAQNSLTEPQAKPKAATGPKPLRQIKRLPNQKGAEEGQTRWFCSGCMKGFLMPTGQEPAACPEGHPWEQVG